MKFTLVQLKYVRMVTRHGSFSEAARQCNVSQPTISNSISEFEDLLGKRIFSRSTRKVELTPFGAALYPIVEEALAAARRIVVEADALLNPDKKLLRIAFTPLLDIKRVSALCDPFRQAHPGIEIIFKECEADSLEDRLISEQIDVVCAHDMPCRRDRDSCPLFEDILHYIPPNGTCAKHSPEISLEAIAAQTVLLTVGGCGLAPTTEALFENRGLTINSYASRAMTHTGLQDWAELGLGGALLPASRIQGEAHKFPVVTSLGEHQFLKFEAVWLKSSTATQHLNMFFKYLPKVAKSLFQNSAEGI